MSDLLEKCERCGSCAFWLTTNDVGQRVCVDINGSDAYGRMAKEAARKPRGMPARIRPKPPEDHQQTKWPWVA